MSPQADYIVANGTGAAVRSDINGQLAAIVSNNSGATEPGTMYAYQWWPDTTTGLLKIRNAANSAWVTVGTLASTNLGLLPVAGGTMTGVLAVTAGTAALPGIAVSGDLNTGIYSPGADQLAISTNGVERVEFGTSEVVFNDAGTNYDFRIEGDTVDSLFFVDASTDRVGIGIATSPLRQLHVNSKVIFDTNGDGTTTIPSIAIGSESVGLSYIGGGHLALLTGDTERLRISSNGSSSSVIPGGSTLYPSFDCRAWVNFNGTGTVAIRASGNVSSITDSGTGDYIVNFTTAMVDANYAAVLGSDRTGSNDTGNVCHQSFLTTSLGLSTFPYNSDIRADNAIVTVAIFR